MLSPTTSGAWDTTLGGSQDAFVTRLHPRLPQALQLRYSTFLGGSRTSSPSAGARVYGASSPGCNGPLPIGVTSMPRIGNASFALTCVNTPASTQGVVAWALGGLGAPLRVPGMGIDLWLDPGRLWVLETATSDARGAADFPLPQDPRLAGLKMHAQLVWLGPTSPPPCPPLGYSASNALEITIQP